MHRRAGTHTAVTWEQFAIGAEKLQDYRLGPMGALGQGAPPARNALVVMVFDVTGYPNNKATLRAFWWGNGGGKYEPFVEQFKLWMGHYHALMGAYDATAGQKVFSEAVFRESTNVAPIDLSGVKKKSFMTLLKIIMIKKLLAIPDGLKGMSNQFLKYGIPDEKLAQDIVSGFFVWAGLLWHMGIDAEITGVPREPEGPPQGYDRHGRVSSGQDRHARRAYRRQ